jgi:hypothetical protein
MPRFQVPQQMINFIVDKYHVSTSDDTIRADIRRRVAQSAARAASVGQKGATDNQLAKMEAYAVKRHHQNQGLYAHVMGGKL